jgi:hypothetical protein
MAVEERSFSLMKQQRLNYLQRLIVKSGKHCALPAAARNRTAQRQLRQWFHGDYHVLLGDGTQLMLSRRYKERLNQCLGWSLNL